MLSQDQCNNTDGRRPQFDYTLQSVDCQLRMAVKNGLPNAIYELVTFQNANINGVDYEGKTPLIIAVTAQRDPDLVELLCRLGADVNYAADGLHGYCALHFAAERNRGSVVDVLLEYGARRDPPTFTGCTPLHLAARHGHVETVRTLCLNGAQVDIQEWYNALTPLHYAIAYAHHDVVCLLLEFNASLGSLLNTAWLTSNITNREMSCYLHEFLTRGTEPRFLENICLDVVRKHFLWPNATKKASVLPLPTSIKQKILLAEYA